MAGPAGGGRQQPVLAARAAQSGDQSSDNGSNYQQAPNQDPRHPGGRPKRTLIESACSACRRRKSRCDGVRPACSRCQTLRTECSYEAEEGESRWSALRRRNQILETERSEMRELLTYLQTRPEPEAQEIFQRIRSGGYEDAFGVLRQLREGGLPSPGGTFPGQASPSFLHQMSSSSSVGSEQRLPPIRSMFDVSGAAAPPPLTLPTMSSYSGSREPSSAHSVSSRSRGSHSSGEQPLTTSAS